MSRRSKRAVKDALLKYNHYSTWIINRPLVAWAQSASGCPTTPFLAKETPVQQMTRNFLHDEIAATAIEYAVLGMFIAIAIVTGASTLGTQLNQAYLNIANGI